MSQTKRRSPRYPACVRARWIVGKQEIEMLAVSISEHGLFLATDRVTDPGMLMNIAVELPDGIHRMIVVARYVGQSADGRGIGAEIFVASSALRRSWTALNVTLARHAHPDLDLAALG